MTKYRKLIFDCACALLINRYECDEKLLSSETVQVLVMRTKKNKVSLFKTLTYIASEDVHVHISDYELQGRRSGARRKGGGRN